MYEYIKTNYSGIWKTKEGKQYQLCDDKWIEFRIFEGFDFKGNWFMQVKPFNPNQNYLPLTEHSTSIKSNEEQNFHKYV